MFHLLRSIERFLKETGMPATRFGRDAVRDPRLVLDMRRGREVGGKDAESCGTFHEHLPRRRCAMTAAAACRDPQEALSDAILALAGNGHDYADFTTISARPWASATFTGRKFRMTLRLEGEDCAARATALASSLPRHDFDIAGQIIADVQIDERSQGSRADGSPFAVLTMTVLTVEDR